MLISAAAHATSSRACVDGPGRRYAVDEILVCPAASISRDRVFAVEYRITLWREGDTRACHPDCDWLEPESSRHAMELRFVPTTAGFHRLDAPSHVPGLEHATALDQRHDGACYGISEPFLPVNVELR